MKYRIEQSKSFKKSLKKYKQKELESIFEVIEKLANDETLESHHKDHALQGKLKDFRECHIKPNLLLIYQKFEDILILVCIDVGSHSKLFKK